MSTVERSLKSDLNDLRRCIQPYIASQSASSDDRILYALLFDCLADRLRRTASGVTPESIFSHIGYQTKNALSLPDKARLAWPADFDETVFGYIYQLFRARRRVDSQKSAQRPNKETSVDEIIAFTQLYTPDWVVDFLVETTLPPSIRANASVIDPSCGSGHFLLRALECIFESKRKIGQDEQTSILGAFSQIAGCDIDETGLFVARLSLTAKALRYVPLDLVPKPDLVNVLEVRHAPLGSLSRNWAVPTHPLNKTYDAVLGNPPYIGRKLLDRALKVKLKTEYADSHQDISAAFISRGLELLKPGGKLGYITQSSILYLPTYSKLRKSILENYRVSTIVEAGAHVFPLQSGEKVNSVLLVLEKLPLCTEKVAASARAVQCLDLTSHKDKEAGLRLAQIEDSFVVREQSDFQSSRHYAFNYGCPKVILLVRKETAKLGDQVDIRQGLATTDNARFVRWWWQVPREELNTRWFPYAKGSGSERWFAPICTVVDWGPDGSSIKNAVSEAYPYLNGKTEWVVKNEQCYFKEGLTFSFVNSKNLSVRWLPAGCIFDVGGSAIFTNAEDRYLLLAYLNSSFVAACAKSINPTINFQVGDLKELPYIAFSDRTKKHLSELSQQCVELKTFLCSFDEKTWRAAPAALLTKAKPTLQAETANAFRKLIELETLIDEVVVAEVSRALKIPRLRTELVEACQATSANRSTAKDPLETDAQFFYKWLTALFYQTADSQIETNSVDTLAMSLGVSPKVVLEAENAVSQPLRKYLSSTFIKQHTRAHHGAPRVVLEEQGSILRIVLERPQNNLRAFGDLMSS